MMFGIPFYNISAKILLLYYTHVILFILDSITVCLAQFRPPDPGGVGFSPSGKPIGALPQTPNKILIKALATDIPM